MGSEIELLPSFSINPSVAKLVDPALSVDDITSNQSNMTLFPNPVNDTSTIRFSSVENTAVKFSIVTILGQEMSSRTIDIQSGENTISLSQDVSVLSKGMYFVNISGANGTVASIKFIK